MQSGKARVTYQGILAIEICFPICNRDKKKNRERFVTEIAFSGREQRNFVTVFNTKIEKTVLFTK